MSEVKTHTVGFRNPARLPDGRIDLEIEHPVYGWVPFTASDQDVEAHGRAIWVSVDAYLAGQGK